MASPSLCECQRASPRGAIGKLIKAGDLDISGVLEMPCGLPSKEEADLFRALREGGEEERLESLQTLIGVYLQVIISTARVCLVWHQSRYERPGASLVELIAVGRGAFIQAAEMHDSNSCGKFSVCAIEAVKIAMLYYLLPGR